MPDLTTLKALIEQLAKNQALPQLGEAATRQAAVNPVLRALGWNTENLDEVVPEFPVRSGGKADYCLRSSGLSLVLIEVKRAGTELDAHQNQLLGYAIAEGAPIAVLTDGLNWWFYLSMSSMAAGKAWHDRRFLHVDFREQGASDAAAALDRFLDRDASVNGAAFRAAEGEFKRQERDLGVRALLPQAWGRVLGDPRVRDLLAEKVEELSGHQPDGETVAEFLRGMPGGGSIDAGPAPRQRTQSRGPRRRRGSRTDSGIVDPVRVGAPESSGEPPQAARKPAADLVVALLEEVGEPLHYREIERRLRERGELESGGRDPANTLLARFFNDPRLQRTGRGTYDLVTRIESAPGAGSHDRTAPAPTTEADKAEHQDYRGTQVAAFWLDGERYDVRSWRLLLQRLCEQLVNEVGPAFAERVADLRGRRRLGEPRPYFRTSAAELRTPLRISGTDLYVEGNLSASSAARVARLTLRAVRGSDEDFRVELVDAADSAGPPSPPATPAPARQEQTEEERGSSRQSAADLAAALLEEVGTPLHYREIERQLRERGKLELGGRDPAYTLLASFSRDPRIRRTTRGTYDLLTRIESAPDAKAHVRPPGASTTESRGEQQEYKGKQVAAFWLDGNRYEAARWNEVLRGICERLATEAGPAFAERVVHLRGRRRPYFSSSPSDLRVPLQVPGADLYAEGNFSANDCVRLARRVLIAVRGSDDGFDIELAE